MINSLMDPRIFEPAPEPVSAPITKDGIQSADSTLSAMERNPLLGSHFGSDFSEESLTPTEIRAVTGATTLGVARITQESPNLLKKRPVYGDLKANIAYITGAHVYMFEVGDSYDAYLFSDAMTPVGQDVEIPHITLTVERAFRDGNISKGYVKFRGSDGMYYALQPKDFDKEGRIGMSWRTNESGTYRGRNEKKYFLLSDKRNSI